ncbi:MAG: HD domain-containing protein [Marinilabiliaceae bacterium]|jgi:putative nucleotidyltransferase with HDIG domain|nr:HD domain-containing protein [Marinilabiliaceae bacterium]
MKKCLYNKIFGIISDVAEELEVDVYVIGGFVRDCILERKSAGKDIDIVVIGNGITMAKTVAGRISRKIKVNIFKNFGTAMFRYKEAEIEFVGARKESYKSASRKPSVEAGSLRDDQERRDFTINALAISLNRKTYGKFLDPFDGVSDLEKKVIRTPLDPVKTFSDDPLRMMRAIRFACQLDFKIEAKTLKGIKSNAYRLKIVSPERITAELNKILLSDRPSVGLNILYDTGLLEQFFPELHELKGIDTKDNRAHKDNFDHTLQVLDNLAQNSDSLYLRWAALLHDIAKPATKKYDEKVGWTFHGHEYIGSKMIPDIFKRLRLPLNENMKYVKKLVALHLRPISLTQDEVTDSAIRRLLFEAGDDIEDLMLLCEADITSKNIRKVQRHLDNFALVRLKLKEIEERDHLRNFQPPVSGEDIIEAFGIKPGRNIGIIKEYIKESILDGIIPNERKEALDLMYRKGEELGLRRKS